MGCCSVGGSRVWCPPGPAEQCPVIGRAPHFFTHLNCPPKKVLWRMEQSLVGLVDETHCCVTHWVPWGRRWGYARAPLACPALGAPCSCAPPDVFQSPGGSWCWFLLLKRQIFGINYIWHEPV